MDIRQLSYFVRVVELGSFSRAAAYLHVAQPALSRQVRNLELELKERLLIRNGRGVEPTEAGLRLLGHAQGVLRLIERTYEDIENSRTGKSGKVAIGMPGSLSGLLGTPLVRRLRSQLADARVHVLHGRSTQLQEMLVSGLLDMAVLFDAPASPMLEAHHLVTEGLYLVGPPDSPRGDEIALRSLADLPMIMPSRPNRVREILERELARSGHKLNVEFEVDRYETCYDLVHDGAGYTVTSRRLQRSSGASPELVNRLLVQPSLTMEIHLVLPARQLVTRLHEAAFRHLREICLENLTWGAGTGQVLTREQIGK